MVRCAVIHVRCHYVRRAPAARRMAARGYAPGHISALLGLSPNRVRDALAGEAANGRVWTEREREVLVFEMGRVA
ncbi:hypothetical protein ABLE91_17010 [Aquabacter sp. CN5-332]|uniref:hypothetical protein n=1 Tax=Aquabacter sp. CN5-332 TaxID=3156608 RepID=UPI0032B53E35